MKEPTVPRFGVAIVPSGHDLPHAIALAQAAEAAGLDFVSILDHPYNPVLGEAWTMVTALALSTERVTVQMAVACMPLRQPAMLAKSAATLQRLVGPRIEIGLGAGAALDGIAAYGGPPLSRKEAFESLREQILILRAMWGTTDHGERDHRVGHYEGFGKALSETADSAGWNDPVSFNGEFHRLDAARPGPAPSEHIPLFVGGYGPKMVAMAAALTDGISVSQGRMTPQQLLAMHQRLDAAAEEAGRDPSGLLRMFNTFGTIGEDDRIDLGGRSGMHGSAGDWAGILAEHMTELRFNAIQYYPHGDINRMKRYAEEVVPAVRERLAPGAIRAGK